MIEELALVSLLASAIALISCLSVEGRRRVRGMPRILWVIVILLVPLAGSIGWFLLGRPHTLSRRPGRWRATIGVPTPARPAAPEDDPAFLRSLPPATPRDRGQRPVRPPGGDLEPPEDPRRGDSPASGSR